MLVLSRKVGEKIIVGNSVTLTVLAVSGNKLRIGIEAPGDIHIRRAVLTGTQDDSSDVNVQPRPTRDSQPDRFGVFATD